MSRTNLVGLSANLYCMQETAVLLIDCPDQRGLMARVSGLLYEEGATFFTRTSTATRRCQAASCGARAGSQAGGATSHYVTEVLDDGPIIAQDVERISHRNQVEHLVARGRDLERIVLSRAVRWHLERRILCYANKKVIFDCRGNRSYKN